MKPSVNFLSGTKSRCYYLIFFSLILIGILLQNCSSSNKHTTNTKKPTDNTEALMDVNKSLVRKDAEAIQNYVKSHNWNTQTTQTGLWYEIYQHGSGVQAKLGKVATISYTISLLDGTLCYTVTPSNPKQFLIGRGGVEQGLEEGILLLREGDKARFIMPPYQAHGLIGDNDKIPARAIIIYDLQLLRISEE